jgi:hypothetical protein
MRFLMALWLTVGPALALMGSVGCEQKTTTVEKKEEQRVHEPRMVSPGEPVVE